MYFIQICLVLVLSALINAENYASATFELPAQQYGTPAVEPSKPFNAYEAPAPAPAVEYSAPEIEYEIVQPETKYGPPSKPETTYSPPPQPETKYGPPPQPETKYGPPPQPQIRYSVPRRIVKIAPVTFEYRRFVTIRRPVITYKLRVNAIPTFAFPSRSYGVPVVPSRRYGVPSF